MNSLTEENYLKALLSLSAQTGEVNVNDVSKSLHIKMPTVTSMMKKLAEKKLVQYESYKPLKLTEKGKKEAGIIVRKHRLTEMFLVQKMGFGWEEVHEIAEQLEHVHSPGFFEKMDEMLGYPTIDPHGSPIPDKNGKINLKQYIQLSDCKANDTIIITAVTNSSADFLQFLNARHIKLGTVLTIKQVEPFDKSMLVQYGKQQQTLSNTVCEKLLGEKQ